MKDGKTLVLFDNLLNNTAKTRTSRTPVGVLLNQLGREFMNVVSCFNVDYFNAASPRVAHRFNNSSLVLVKKNFKLSNVFRRFNSQKIPVKKSGKFLCDFSFTSKNLNVLTPIHFSNDRLSLITGNKGETLFIGLLFNKIIRQIFIVGKMHFLQATAHILKHGFFFGV